MLSPTEFDDAPDEPEATGEEVRSLLVAYLKLAALAVLAVMIIGQLVIRWQAAAP